MMYSLSGHETLAVCVFLQRDRMAAGRSEASNDLSFVSAHSI